MNNDLLILAVALVFIQLVVSVMVLKNENFSSQQKIFQIALAWLIPLFGALCCFIMARSFNNISQPRSKNHDPLYIPTDGG
jgi:ABC-type nickel/cobalt efflux system permease component RcnA